MSRAMLSALTLLHFLRTAWAILATLLYHPFVPNPLPLNASRSKTPSNLALVLSETTAEPSEEESEAILGSVVRAVRYCEAAGINSLCVYDRNGTSKRLSRRIQRIIRLETSGSRDYLDSEAVSDSSDSERSTVSTSSLASIDSCCSLPPIVTLDLGTSLDQSQGSGGTVKGSKALRRRGKQRSGGSSRVNVSLASYDASKPLMASITQDMVESARRNSFDTADVSPKELGEKIQEIIQIEHPDLMIVHPIQQHSLICPPLEFFGFPPWLLMLTEVYYDTRPSIARAWQNRAGKQNYVALPEDTFRHALDSFAGAQMRLGK